MILNDILIYYFRNYTSILTIASLENSETDSVTEIFDFKPVTPEEVKKETLNLDSKKATNKGDCSVNFLKNPISTHLPFGTKCFCIGQKKFPDKTKIVDAVTIFKIKDPFNQASELAF